MKREKRKRELRKREKVTGKSGAANQERGIRATPVPGFGRENQNGADSFRVSAPTITSSADWRMKLVFSQTMALPRK